MIPIVPITQETLQGYEKHLWARGCFAKETIRAKMTVARRLQADLGRIPLDEDQAILAVGKIPRLTPRYRRRLYTGARDLIDFLNRPKEAEA